MTTASDDSPTSTAAAFNKGLKSPVGSLFMPSKTKFAPSRGLRSAAASMACSIPCLLALPPRGIADTSATRQADRTEGVDLPVARKTRFFSPRPSCRSQFTAFSPRKARVGQKQSVTYGDAAHRESPRRSLIAEGETGAGLRRRRVQFEYGRSFVDTNSTSK
jgi:hypothetical protein